MIILLYLIYSLHLNFKQSILDRQEAWREVLVIANKCGIPVPAFSSSLDYFDSYRSDRLPQNVTQAQRDYFGAHTYERTDKPRGEFFPYSMVIISVLQ